MSSRFFAAVLLIACSLDAQDPGFVLRVPTVENAAAWRDHILPSAQELRWESIPWEQTFGDGLRAASEQGKPLLFYAMNGHPLGCT